MIVDDTTRDYILHLRKLVIAEKAPSRKELLKQEKKRNLYLRQLLENDVKAETPTLYELRVSIDSELREERNMKKEKRGRVFIRMAGDAAKTIGGLVDEVKSAFRALDNCSLTLSAELPKVLQDGSIFCPDDEQRGDNSDPYKNFWVVDNDDAVMESFRKADEYFSSHNQQLPQESKSRLRRPSILIHVMKDTNVSDLENPSYLTNMPNPKDTEKMIMLSFYSFPLGGITDPEDFLLFLKKAWEPFNALGRVYIAEEGINAQMSVPANVIQHFAQCCAVIPEMGEHIENGINVDPVPLTIEQFAVAGNIDGKACPPFKTLLLKVRQKIVADGLNKPLKWESAGYDMPPLEWHQKLKEAREARGKRGNQNDASVPLIFDCRNTYETEVGIFEGAEPLGTENFRDSWEAIHEKLKDKPKDIPIMTYCTGGIRCVKIGAYLTQEMGFTNVSRLAGGIIAYDRTLNNNAPEEEPMFKGTNYVFDGRVGRQITNDALGICITCGQKTNLLNNCKNSDCHRRMVQCETCNHSYTGSCSAACREMVTEILNKDSLQS